MSKSYEGSLKIHNRYARAFNYVILALAVMVILVPVLIVASIAFKTREEFGTGPLLSLPKTFLISKILSLQCVMEK